jgi:hypothetical protein
MRYSPDVLLFMHRFIHQRLQQRILGALLVALNVQPSGHVVRQIKQLSTARHRQLQRLCTILDSNQVIAVVSGMPDFDGNLTSSKATYLY